MKAKDLDKYLDIIIADGMIKEADQNNIELINALRHITDDEFYSIVAQDKLEPAYNDDLECDFETSEANISYDRMMPETACAMAMPEPDIATHMAPEILSNRSEISLAATSAHKKNNIWQKWIISIMSAVAIVAIVLIYSYNMINNRLCDSALMATELYNTSFTVTFDISNATEDEIREHLPALEANYRQALESNAATLQDTGWTLTTAYLKLHKKGDAVKVLKELDSRFGAQQRNLGANPYQVLLRILD